MDWNGSNLRAFVSRPDSSFSFLYNYNCDPFPGVEMKHPAMAETVQGTVPAMDRNMSYGTQEKKKRLSSDQLDELERNFQEEIKLDPDRKMKLSRELGLQPRQIAVWFQNRRARWKAKQLERLYDALKQEYNAMSREKHKLQEEVLKLKGMLGEQVMNKMQVSTGYTDISGEETVESTSRAQATSHQQHQTGECNYVFNVDDYNPVSPTYWAVPN